MKTTEKIYLLKGLKCLFIFLFIGSVLSCSPGQQDQKKFLPKVQMNIRDQDASKTKWLS